MFSSHKPTISSSTQTQKSITWKKTSHVGLSKRENFCTLYFIGEWRTFKAKPEQCTILPDTLNLVPELHVGTNSPVNSVKHTVEYGFLPQSIHMCQQRKTLTTYLFKNVNFLLRLCLNFISPQDSMIWSILFPPSRRFFSYLPYPHICYLISQMSPILS